MGGKADDFTGGKPGGAMKVAATHRERCHLSGGEGVCHEE